MQLRSRPFFGESGVRFMRRRPRSASGDIHPNDTVGYPWMGDQRYTTIAPYLH